MPKIHLRKGHVQPVWAGHPWIFAQAVRSVEGAPAPGDVVGVHDPRGNFLGKGFYSPKSAIAVRILSRDPDETLNGGFIARRLERASAWRRSLLGLPDAQNTGYRLAHAEGDGLAGLVVDVFGEVAVVQLLTIGMKRLQNDIFTHIARVAGAKTVIEIGHRVQKLEGFEVERRIVRGKEIDALRFLERGLEISIPFGLDQKTGYYFDQRENRATAGRLSKGRRVLDAFSYVGGFALAAARGGASEVICLDSSAPAIAAGAAIARHNGLADSIEHRRGDAKRELVAMQKRGERFDMVIIDPPKLIPTIRHIEAGRGAYRKLNANAMRLVEPGGLLLSCSCSGAFAQDDFLRMLGYAARDAGREASLLHASGQAPDHPSPPAFPDGRYLKFAVLRVDR
ncbi:MAG: class I SAM-dependent rRNA methyltransferase [Myxococcales bacterium]|nr:class I SAM-dependent rRNA methyltransferase [Myxococcales bacterium]